MLEKYIHKLPNVASFLVLCALLMSLFITRHSRLSERCHLVHPEAYETSRCERDVRGLSCIAQL